jgi:hypothetical protein
MVFPPLALAVNPYIVTFFRAALMSLLIMVLKR